MERQFLLREPEIQLANPNRLRIMQQRAQELFRRAGDAMGRDGVLTEAFDELVSALEVLQVGQRERDRQLEGWLNERAALEAEVQRYRDLFMHASIAYFVTSIDGTIRLVNMAAAQLFGTTEKGLVGRSLSLFLPTGQRRLFRNEVAEVAQSGERREWKLSLQSLDNSTFEATVQASPNLSQDGRTLAIWWLMQPL